jgi:hypothetical protein
VLDFEEKSMETNVQAVPRVILASAVESSANTSSIEDPANASHAARSANNILQWTAFLPEDCVKTMIRMGWDVTT